VAVGTIIGICSSSVVRAAEGIAPEDSDLAITLHADSYRIDQQARIITAEGHVVLSAQGVVVRADILVAMLQTGLVSAEGNVQLEVAGQTVAGQRLTFDLRTRQGTLFNAVAEYRSPLVLGTVRLQAEELTGNLERFVSIRKGFATTCNAPTAFAHLTADELQIYPHDKIVGHGVTVWVGGYAVITVPYFIIFLRELRDTPITPLVGYRDPEGWFIHTSWSYFLNENHYGLVHTDWFERLGVGLGIEHLYRFGGGEGSAFVYRRANRQTGGADIRGVLSHLQHLGDVSLRTYTDYQELSSVTPPTTSTLYTSVDLSAQTPYSSSYLFSSLSRSSVGPTSTLTGRAADLRMLGPRLTGELSVDYSRNASPTTVDEELLPRYTLRFFGETLSATLVTEARWSLPGNSFTSANRYILERLPELRVSPAPFRVGETYLFGQPEVGWGQFRETTPGPTGRVSSAGRADAQLTISGPVAFAGGIVWTRVFGRQSWYTTGDARTFYGGRAEYVKAIDPGLDASVAYTGQTAIGGSPFIFDQTLGTLNVAEAQVTHHTQDLLVRATGYYDFQARQFGNAVGQILYLPRSDWSVGLAASYNVNVGRLDRVEAALDVQFDKEWRLEYSGAWDSISQNIFNNRISLTRTFCDCLAVSLTYLGARSEIWLEAWLTAIPWGRGKIGIGAQGTLLFEQPWWVGR
jgi:hypothetical protein